MFPCHAYAVSQCASSLASFAAVTGPSLHIAMHSRETMSAFTPFAVVNATKPVGHRNTKRASTMRRQQTAFIVHEEPALGAGSALI
jgi:hypothetical protein